MAKKIFLIAILILGCSVYTFQNESKATISNNSASDSGNLNDSKTQKHVPPPYKILNNRYVSRSTIKKSVTPNNGVTIRLLQNGIDNLEIEDFSWHITVELNTAWETYMELKIHPSHYL